MVINEVNEGEEEAESEDEYAETSPNGRWHRRDQTVQVQGMYGVSASYLAMDMEEGKEVVWNEIEVSEEMSKLLSKDSSREAVEKVLKIFKRIEHANLVKYGGYWLVDRANDIKIVYITEYTSAGTLRSFLRRSRINNKRIGARVWRRWCRQILCALDYLHSSEPSITHGHLNCDTIYIQHDGYIKVGSVAPNIIKDFLQSLKEGKDFDEKACYKTPNSQDICDFGKCLAEVFATGIEDPDMKSCQLVYQNDNPNKKRKARDLTTEERKFIVEACGEDKRAFLEECFSRNPETTASSLSFDKIFIEVPPLRVMAFYALSRAKIPIKFEEYHNSEKERHRIIEVNNQKLKHEMPPLDYDKLKTDIENGMFPICGIDVNASSPNNDASLCTEKELTQVETSKEEERLILTVKCEVNPAKSDDNDLMNLFLEFQMTDQMIRQLNTEISVKEDNPQKLVDELIRYNLLNKGDRQMVIESLEEVLSS